MGAGKALKRVLRTLPKKKKIDSVADASEYKAEAALKKEMKKETESSMPWLKNPKHKDAPKKLSAEEIERWMEINKNRTTPQAGTPLELRGGDYVGWGLSKEHKRKHGPKSRQ
tara:strand:+ start:269 stop:607 length:339 start_codon:yes stop_codon:yes gene_type:complete